MKPVNVYRRGAIISCWEIGGKFYPCADYQQYTFADFRMVIGFERIWGPS